MISLGRLLTATAVLALLAAPAHAQNLNSGATGTHGQVHLQSGYQPDPYGVTVSAGGDVEAARASEECAGFVASRPSFSLRYSAGDLPLYIGAVSETDTTILVRGPDRSWRCDDDSGGDLNPLVSWDEPRSGRYQIWVGRYGVESETAPALLHISEIGGPAMTTADALPDYSLDPAYGEVSLEAGFLPDPHTMEIAAGGSIDASVIPECVGWIAQAPDYRLQWTAGEGDSPLVFSVASDSDTTLVINLPNGDWICDDDGGNEGLNPSISIAAPPSGQYDIWVGTYAEGGLQPSTLHISELYSQ